MPDTTDVNLPKSHVALFPDRCVVCEREHPSSHVRILTGSIGWWTFLWMFGSPFYVKAPACRFCGWKLQWMRLLSLAVTLTIVAVAMLYAWPYLQPHVPKAFRKWGMMGFAILCLLPQIIFEIVFPKPFDVTAFSDNVNYEFRSRRYAVDFSLQNGDALWVKINGHVMSDKREPTEEPADDTQD